jgi:hypothetical protein
MMDQRGRRRFVPLVSAPVDSSSAHRGLSVCVCARHRRHRLTVVDVVLARTETMSTLRAAFRPRAANGRHIFWAAQRRTADSRAKQHSLLGIGTAEKSLCRRIFTQIYVFLTPDFQAAPHALTMSTYCNDALTATIAAYAHRSGYARVQARRCFSRFSPTRAAHPLRASKPSSSFFSSFSSFS